MRSQNATSARSLASLLTTDNIRQTETNRVVGQSGKSELHVKSELQPAQCFTCLDMTFSTLTMRVTLKEKRLRTLRTTLVSMRSRNATSARLLASLFGMMEGRVPLVSRWPDSTNVLYSVP